jgi:hypothetical protein
VLTFVKFRYLGDAHPDSLTSRSNLAYRAGGRLDEATPLHGRTLADRERVLGDTDPGTLGSRSNLGLAYRAGGWLDEAISLLKRTLAERERIRFSQRRRAARRSCQASCQALLTVGCLRDKTWQVPMAWTTGTLLAVTCGKLLADRPPAQMGRA